MKHIMYINVIAGEHQMSVSEFFPVSLHEYMVYQGRNTETQFRKY